MLTSPVEVVSKAAPASQHFRIDIQALRGLAILLVLLHHGRLLPWLKAGHLGVDVFFVVSGYLITGILQRALADGTFSFTGFYFRRAKRLLPAAYVTFAVTALLSALFLTRPEMRDFTWQLLGAVTFTGNIALWMQTGYFEGAAHLKPLLHVWSLSIEEQYYLLLPAALVFTPRRFWKVGMFALVAGSLLLCFALLPAKPGAVFYLLPTRAWELGLGSLGVLALEGSVAGAWLARLFWPALAALLVVPFFPTGAPHPGLDALIVCTATLVVLLRRHPVLNRGWPARGLAHLGDISYSLYLVHWPLLAFAANASLWPVPGVVRLALVFTAVVLAWALYRWVERPVRQAEIQYNRKTAMLTLGTSSALVLIGFAIFHLQSSGDSADYAHIRRFNHGLNPICQYGDKFEPKPECQNAQQPRIMVWGDLTAKHLVDGVVASGQVGLIQVTQNGCGSLLNISRLDPNDGFGRTWAEGCIKFNQSVIDYLGSHPSIEVVVLASSFGEYLGGKRLVGLAQDWQRDALPAFAELDGGELVALKNLRATVSAVRAMGKRVVIVAPPPSAAFNIGRCLELKANGKVFIGADTPSCAVSEASYHLSKKAPRAFLDHASEEIDVSVIRFDDFLCRAGTCATEINGTFLYRDGGHLSVDGSRLLGREMGLAGKILTTAR